MGRFLSCFTPRFPVLVQVAGCGAVAVGVGLSCGWGPALITAGISAVVGGALAEADTEETG